MTAENRHDGHTFAVIGAGINGTAVAREITRRFPDAVVTIFEKSDRVAAHQSGHNSGVVHAGLYYEPGSLKARLCRRGVHLLHDYARSNQLPFEECGKIVVALTPEEEERLHDIHERAVANGVPDVELIGPDRIREIEPNSVGRLALHSPHTAITDYAAIARSFAEDVEAAGGTIHLNAEVVDMNVQAHGCTITSERGTDRHVETFDFVIACAGLQSDRVAKMAGGATHPTIVPFFGQYSQLAPEHRTILNGLVYPVPDPAYPFLGVHLTKRVDGEMLVGPNAFLSFGRENYSGRKIGIKDSLTVAADPAFWKFAAGNMKAAVREFAAVVSRKKFLAGAAEYVPSLKGAVSKPIPRGIRAQAMDADGGLVDDFVIEQQDRATLIRNAPSPGATSSMAIAEHIVDVVTNTHDLLPSSPESTPKDD
ncbi:MULTISPECIES: L-2-hydroxyglutarate oxidase [unclassified Brevibacterium]|uniref:L-2-hydroxyglutarate oxidase n=1 Tax=unclassified Brevibacterium TaxID=2614124 RepID=UPI001091FF70|nr:L-2-hydroxyglutarate oxidase [Brevibacterium sp. S22]TGD29716.1 L-2-hydroxyglutarate oxidase [Brevibacterium sp. S22]